MTVVTVENDVSNVGGVSGMRGVGDMRGVSDMGIDCIVGTKRLIAVENQRPMR